MLCIFIFESGLFKNGFNVLTGIFRMPDFFRGKWTAARRWIIRNIVADKVSNGAYNIRCTLLVNPAAIAAFTDVIVGLCQKITDRLLGQHHTSLTLHDHKKES